MSALPAAAAALPAVSWRAGDLQDALGRIAPGLRVEVLAEADSTNTRLLERARAGDAQPTLLVAERQTAGRGRLGRAWWSGPASNGSSSLTFSLGITLAPRAWSGLSLAVGVALAEALDPHGTHRVRLKWPNDLWLVDAAGGSGRKFAGVLIETLAASSAGARHAVIGIGVNLDAPAAEADIGQATAGWREVEPASEAPRLLAQLAPALLEALMRFEAHGFAAFAERYAARDALAGRSVTVVADPAFAGRADGVDADGALRLLTPAGLRLIDSSEVSVRPC